MSRMGYADISGLPSFLLRGQGICTNEVTTTATKKNKSTLRVVKSCRPIRWSIRYVDLSGRDRFPISSGRLVRSTLSWWLLVGSLFRVAPSNRPIVRWMSICLVVFPFVSGRPVRSTRRGGFPSRCAESSRRVELWSYVAIRLWEFHLGWIEQLSLT